MKSSAIFISAGNHSSFLDYCINNLINHCDLYVNFYGEDLSSLKTIQNYSTFFSVYKTTKFPALKKIYSVSGIDKYENVFVYDDDCVIEYGDILSILDIMNTYKLKVAAPCQNNKAKWSHKIMLKHEGNHIFRYTNFVEMNFPVFSQECLYQYMNIYDGELYGWGNDWWYLNMLDARKNKVCGIIDSICVSNPNYSDKKFASDSIDSFVPRDSRRLQWEKLRHRIKLHEWPGENLEFIYP